MARAKTNLFALLGWLVWRLLALVGLPMAKKKLAGRDDHRSRR